MTAMKEVKDEFLDMREVKDESSVDVKEDPEDLHQEYGTSPFNVRLCLLINLLHFS